jgi:hypothetical protein
MKGQSSLISVVIIAGIVVSLVGASYMWAVPLIEKRSTIADYIMIENFMINLNDKIVEIANTGSGEATLSIPSGKVHAFGYGIIGKENNTLRLDFFVDRPLIGSDASVPIDTSSLDYIGEYGMTEPRIMTLSAPEAGDLTHLYIDMRYRELRSAKPQGYVISLCPPGGGPDCNSEISGRSEVRVFFDRSVVEDRDPADGGPLTKIYIGMEAY